MVSKEDKAKAEVKDPWKLVRGLWQVRCRGEMQGTLHFERSEVFYLNGETLGGLEGVTDYADCYLTQTKQLKAPDFQEHEFMFYALRGRQFEGAFRIITRYYLNVINHSLLSGVLAYGSDKVPEYKLFNAKRIIN